LQQQRYDEKVTIGTGTHGVFKRGHTCKSEDERVLPPFALFEGSARFELGGGIVWPGTGEHFEAPAPYFPD
jgi:hypothetical protein